MKHLSFWFDPISPYAYLAFERLPQVLEGVSYSVGYRPVLFAGLLKQFDHKGPAEIEPKRAWTYRDVAWRAHTQGTRLDLPVAHPFNPLPLLRLALACARPGGTPNRRVVEALFHHVWQGGQDAASPDRLAALRQALAPERDPDGAEVKAELRAGGETALAQGVFGVPTMVCEGRLFWGDDALPMLRAALQGDPWFEGPGWAQADQPRPQVSRT
ncbi:MAG: DsbA family protein [Betaproteobacteria bacterium]|jgi:2-hydroxychromene-2-carboxylate isomerase